jgi:hypothetical protein
MHLEFDTQQIWFWSHLAGWYRTQRQRVVPFPHRFCQQRKNIEPAHDPLPWETGARERKKEIDKQWWFLPALMPETLAIQHAFFSRLKRLCRRRRRPHPWALSLLDMLWHQGRHYWGWRICVSRRWAPPIRKEQMWGKKIRGHALQLVKQKKIQAMICL